MNGNEYVDTRISLQQEELFFMGYGQIGADLELLIDDPPLKLAEPSFHKENPLLLLLLLM